ncbi:MAG: GDP-mannose 4,6-dehydratase [Candidatus Diapherotrites archaeon]|nr:GDP-mannose 4,6-dehydratase [Candidatus Diapherotrites archaeon]
MEKDKTALITGITGQDGSYLAELLLKKGYRVVGMVRETGKEHHWRIAHLEDQIEFVYGDLQDYSSVYQVIQTAHPDEVYNLGAQTFVKASFDNPIITGNITGLGVIRMLEAIRKINPKIKFYQASSSEMFGKVNEIPQKETTPFYPRSPYGVAKMYGYWATINYRESYNMFACNGILFNHESPRRGLEFVTRKISNGVAKIKLGKQKEIKLGNLESKRDWGYAKEYVETMWKIMQHKKADDFVIGTGEQHSVQEFCQLAFDYVGLDYTKHVKIDPANKRPAEVDTLLADSSKAKKELGWKPKISFKELVELMVDADLEFEKKRQ